MHTGESFKVFCLICFFVFTYAEVFDWLCPLPIPRSFTRWFGGLAGFEGDLMRHDNKWDISE